MKQAVLVLSTWCLALCTVYAQDFKSDKEQLRYLKEVEWPKSYYDQDTILLDRILAEEFEMINAEGKRFRKSDEMAYIKKNKPSYKSFNYEITRLEIFENNTAIIAGMGTVISVNDEGKETKMTYWSSNVLIKRGEHWKAISSHVSGIKKEMAE